MTIKPTPEAIDKLYKQLTMESEAGGYNLNPDEDFTRDLVEALLTNNQRYGYQSCPCRLAAGIREQDLDIICPCDYRDPDLTEFGACYCALYVSNEIARGEQEAEPIPERRGKREGPHETGSGGATVANAFRSAMVDKMGETGNNLPFPVWRCPVCGYLCAREHPPEKCPICKADKDRFRKFF